MPSVSIDLRPLDVRVQDSLKRAIVKNRSGGWLTLGPNPEIGFFVCQPFSRIGDGMWKGHVNIPCPHGAEDLGEIVLGRNEIGGANDNLPEEYRFDDVTIWCEECDPD